MDSLVNYQITVIKRAWIRTPLKLESVTNDFPGVWGPENLILVTPGSPWRENRPKNNKRGLPTIMRTNWGPFDRNISQSWGPRVLNEDRYRSGAYWWSFIKKGLRAGCELKQTCYFFYSFSRRQTQQRRNFFYQLFGTKIIICIQKN